MKITNSPSAFCGNKIKIASKAKENIKVPYLYNNVLDIVKECKVPAVFSNDNIEISSVTKDVVKQLKERGIKFDTIV